ncbi:GNAT family N-acetyltransferase [Streptomyces sp. NPDC054784]
MLREEWHAIGDVAEFHARAGEFLRSRPARHNTVLTDVEKLRARGARQEGGESGVFGVLESGGEIRAAFHPTPRGHVGATPLTPGQADAAAALLHRLGATPAGVVADHTTAAAFARAWQARTGAVPEPFWRTHLYRLGTLTPPRSPAPGRGRAAGAADREPGGHVVRWCRAFCAEVGERVSLDLIDGGHWAASRFGDRHFTFWETPEGVPAAMAARTAPTGGMVRVDPVYTPPELRGRGYAAAVTTEVSRAAREAGAAEVVLYADPANPASNALYRRLGYTRLADFSGYRFPAT